MRGAGGLRSVVQVALVLVVLALLAGQVLGYPILFGYVETGSMEPTIETGDGFVAIPNAITGEPTAGDVVVFDAQEIEGGGLTTHRIAEETDRGYVTVGDANPVTDQDAGEPYVQEGQIYAHVWQPGDEVVTIPSLGVAVEAISGAFDTAQSWLATNAGLTALEGTSGLAYLLLGISALAYLVETFRERAARSRQSRLGRETSVPLDPRLLAGAFALLVVIAAGAAMVVPAGTTTVDVISAEFESDRQDVIEAGTTEELEYAIPNTGVVPVVSYVEPASEGVGAGDDPYRVGPRDEAETTLSLTAPDETGYYPMHATEYRYLHVLPLPVIDTLYQLHPWVPLTTILVLIGTTTYVIGRFVIGEEDVRTRRKRLTQRQQTAKEVHTR